MITPIRTSTPPDRASPAPRVVTDEEFGAICDVCERAWLNLPVDSYKDDDGGVTSDEARASARRVLEILGIAMREVSMTEVEASAIAAYLANTGGV